MEIENDGVIARGEEDEEDARSLYGSGGGVLRPARGKLSSE